MRFPPSRPACRCSWARAIAVARGCDVDQPRNLAKSDGEQTQFDLRKFAGRQGAQVYSLGRLAFAIAKCVDRWSQDGASVGSFHARAAPSHRAFVIAGLRRSNAAKATGSIRSAPPAGLRQPGSAVRIPILAWRSFLNAAWFCVPSPWADWLGLAFTHNSGQEDRWCACRVETMALVRGFEGCGKGFVADKRQTSGN